jgi:hypothetical protein
MGTFTRPHGAGLEAGHPYFQREQTYLYFNKKSGRWFISTTLGSVYTKMRSGKPLNAALPKDAKNWESWDRATKKWNIDRAIKVTDNCPKGSNVPSRNSQRGKNQRPKPEGATNKLSSGTYSIGCRSHDFMCQ